MKIISEKFIHTENALACCFSRLSPYVYNFYVSINTSVQYIDQIYELLFIFIINGQVDDDESENIFKMQPINAQIVGNTKSIAQF